MCDISLSLSFTRKHRSPSPSHCVGPSLSHAGERDLKQAYGFPLSPKFPRGGRGSG